MRVGRLFLGFVCSILTWCTTSSALPEKCGPDRFARLFSNPEGAKQIYLTLLHKMEQKGRPRNAKQAKALFQQILALPDPPPSVHVQLEEMHRAVSSWRHRPEYPYLPAIERAIALRMLVSGIRLSRLDTAKALECLEVDDAYFATDEAPLIWKHRLEVALIRQGESEEWERNETGPFLEPTKMTTGSKPPDLYRQNGGDDPIKHHDEGFRRRTIANQVLGELALNPNAKSHRMAIQWLLSSATIWEERRRGGLHLDSYPRGLIQGLTGYLNPDVFPATKRDPQIEMRIREILPKLGISLKGEELTSE